MLANIVSIIRDFLVPAETPPRDLWPEGDTATGMRRLMRELNEPLGSEFMIAGLAQLPRFAERGRIPARQWPPAA